MERERQTELLSDNLILAFRSEAGAASDPDAETFASQALEGDEAARERVAEMLNDARAAASEDGTFVRVIA